jgi:hypothetical protein
MTVRRFALLIAGVVALSALAWWYVDDSEPAKPAPKSTPTPSQVDKLIAFCKDPAHLANPLCKVDPNDPAAVADAVRDAEARIVERERIVESDDDDDAEAPDVNVSVPRSDPTQAPSSPAPTTATTRPPIVQPIEIPDLPLDAPELPDLPVPLPGL